MDRTIVHIFLSVKILCFAAKPTFYLTDYNHLALLSPQQSLSRMADSARNVPACQMKHQSSIRPS